VLFKNSTFDMSNLLFLFVDGAAFFFFYEHLICKICITPYQRLKSYCVSPSHLFASMQDVTLLIICACCLLKVVPSSSMEYFSVQTGFYNLGKQQSNVFERFEFCC